MKKALGLDLANLTDDLRKKHNIKEKVKGVVITGVDPNSAAAEKRLEPGMVIAEVQQQPVTSAAELQQRIEKLKKDGKKAAVLLVVSPDSDPSFVAQPAVGLPGEIATAGAACTGRLLVEHVIDHAVGEFRLEPGHFGGMIPLRRPRHQVTLCVG